MNLPSIGAILLSMCCLLPACQNNTELSCGELGVEVPPGGGDEFACVPMSRTVAAVVPERPYLMAFDIVDAPEPVCAGGVDLSVINWGAVEPTQPRQDADEEPKVLVKGEVVAPDSGKVLGEITLLAYFVTDVQVAEMAREMSGAVVEGDLVPKDGTFYVVTQCDSDRSWEGLTFPGYVGDWQPPEREES